jgi:hypothetical protein
MTFEEELSRLLELSGVKNKKNLGGSNISLTGNEKAKLMKKHKIKPGTKEWFKLWFSLPYLTGEKPI